MPNLTAAQAARLMTGLDPDVFESLDSRPNKNDSSAATHKARMIHRLAEAEGKQLDSPAGWLAWADEKGFRVHVGYRLAVEEKADAKKNAPSMKTDAAAVGAAKTNETDWQSQVRLIADELDAKDAKADGGPWSSLEDMSDRVARIADERGLRGPHGKLTAPNILRMALQGGRWQRSRDAPKRQGHAKDPSAIKREAGKSGKSQN